MAKRFFLICGGVLMLAIAWRVAVPPAHAQSGTTVDAGVGYYCGNSFACLAAVVGRTFYIDGAPITPQIPGTSKAGKDGLRREKRTVAVGR